MKKITEIYRFRKKGGLQMKKLILFIITMLSIIFIVNENLNLISNIFRILSALWIYILAKKYNVWG